MSLAQLPNPVIAARVLLDSFREMKDEEYEKALGDTLRRGEIFAASYDAEFSASLSEADAARYGAFRQPFLNAFDSLKKVSDCRRLSMAYLAQTIAWWQLVSAFRTLYGKPLPE